MGWKTGFISGRGRDFSTYSHIQTSFGTHAAYYPMGTGGFFFRGEFKV
jgi:hypothetical protein